MVSLGFIFSGTRKKKRPTRAFVKLVSWFHFFSSWFHNFVKLVLWFHFKNETGSRIFEHENTKCKLQTAIYYCDFGILQKTKFFGFIFMKLQFRCKNHASYLNFSSTLMKLSENFRLLYIEIVFDAIIWRRFFPLMKLFTVFFTVSFFFSSFTFLWN